MLKIVPAVSICPSFYSNMWQLLWNFRTVFPPFEAAFCSFLNIIEGGNLAASKIRNLECPSYEICLIDYGCGKFNRKIHIMEQYP